ncbi:MAG: alpha/beta hydrolase [Clostridiales bacterium]|nr:alpha/beta hydrolase [Clostridiales bacterium]
MKTFTIGKKEISVYPAKEAGRPVIYLNSFASEAGKILGVLEKMGHPDFTLVAICKLEWDHDMAPWDIPPISKLDTPCTGGADDYLKLLTEKIMPEAEKNIDGEPAWRGIAGYSLAGLFAIYSIYRTDIFSRAASMSGSLWFPKIKEFIFENEPMKMPERIYFSLGDKECKTRNKYLKVVQKNTEEIENFYSEKGINTVFKLNPGNHYVNAAERSAAGLLWILEE